MQSDAPKEEAVGGPIMDSLKAKVAQLIDKIDISEMSLAEIIALAKTLIALFANKQTFSSSESAAEVTTLAAELESLCQQTETGS
jgi:hypothetical protein